MYVTYVPHKVMAGHVVSAAIPVTLNYYFAFHATYSMDFEVVGNIIKTYGFITCQRIVRGLPSTTSCKTAPWISWQQWRRVSPKYLVNKPVEV